MGGFGVSGLFLLVELGESLPDAGGLGEVLA